MKILLSLSFVFLSLLITKAQDHTAPLTDIVEKISNSWQNIDAENKKGIKLESLTATFTLSKTQSSGFGLNIWIFKLGRKVEKNKVRKITLELATEQKTVKANIDKNISDELTKFLNATLLDFKKMNDSGLLTELNERKLTIEVGLTITKDKTAEGAYEIGIFTLSAEAGRKSEQGHTLTLVFSKA